jgi:C-terminal processing protease CtpA/Prc
MKPIGGLFLMLLLGVGLYLYLSAENAKTVITTAKPARELAEQVSGQGMRGSFALEKVESNGKVTGLRVKSLSADGLFAKLYDIRVGDIITGVGPLSIRDSDPEMLEAQLLEAGARPHKLMILRDGQKLELEHHGRASGGSGRVPGGNLNPTNLPGLP